MRKQKCRTCLQVKPLNDFYYDKKNQSYRSECAYCHKANARNKYTNLTKEEKEALSFKNKVNRQCRSPIAEMLIEAVIKLHSKNGYKITEHKGYISFQNYKHKSRIKNTDIIELIYSNGETYTIKYYLKNIMKKESN